MYDINKINRIIDDINRFFIDLERIKLDEKSIKDSTNLHGGAMLIFGIINRTIDLSEEILVKNDLPMPSAYHECFPALGKAGLLDKKLSSELESLAKERGLFAHHYYDTKTNKVLKLSKDIYVAKQFIDKVKNLVRKEEGKK
jgi:uncharacterized protein YutE (UPF0331/DUF86 family)